MSYLYPPSQFVKVTAPFTRTLADMRKKIVLAASIYLGGLFIGTVFGQKFDTSVTLHRSIHEGGLV